MVSVSLTVIYRAPTGPEKFRFLETEKSGPEMFWNWTFVLKKAWKSANIWINQACTLFAIEAPMKQIM